MEVVRRLDGLFAFLLPLLLAIGGQLGAALQDQLGLPLLWQLVSLQEILFSENVWHLQRLHGLLLEEIALAVVKASHSHLMI